MTFIKSRQTGNKYIFHFLYWIGATYSLIITTLFTAVSNEPNEFKVVLVLLGMPLSALGALVTFWVYRHFLKRREKLLYKDPFGHFLAMDGFQHYGSVIAGHIKGYLVEITYDLDIGSMRNVIKYTVFYDMGLTHESSVINKIETLQYRYSKKYVWGLNGVAVSILLPFTKPSYDILKKKIETTVQEVKLEHIKPAEFD